MGSELSPTADYKHGVRMAGIVACRVLRAMGVDDEVFTAMASAIREAEDHRPLYGAPPKPTQQEVEIERRRLAALTSPEQEHG